MSSGIGGSAGSVLRLLALTTPTDPDQCTVPLVTERRAHEALASNLHRLMFQKSITLEAVARAAKLTPERLRAICDGSFDPDIEVVGRIAQAVGVTASELIAEPQYN